MKSIYLSLLLSTLSLASIPGEACTGIKLTAKDGSIVHGRTAEFGVQLDFSALVIPRGYPFTGTTPNGPGLSYKAKYGTLGIVCFDSTAILDGMNEKGLSVGAFYFPGYAKYAEITANNQAKALSPIEFSNWILTQHATIDEVLANLKNVAIAPTVVENWGSTPPPFHYIVFDKSGKSIVIEPVNGTLKTYENKLGIVTNSPQFDWHMTNLNNYVHLSPFNAKPITIQGITFTPFGQGSGMTGLPGDFSPPSRFVRAAIFSITATPSATAQDAVSQAFHILNQFDIPVGLVRAEENGVVHTDATLATAVRDPQSLKFYFRTYEDQNLRVIDLNTFDLNAKTLQSFTLSKEQSYEDVSAQFKAMAE